MEVSYRVNKLLDSARVSVTTSAQKIFDLHAFDQSLIGQIKSIIINNMSNGNIYYGSSASVSTSNAGGVIYPSQSKEIPMVDLNYSPYFIAGSTLAAGLEFWG
jgi:hypothetical protein